MAFLSAPAWAQDDDRLGEGYNLLDAGKFADAIGDFQQVLRRNPDDIKAHEGLAWAYYGAGDAANAAVEADRRLQLAPTDGDWRRSWALIIASVPARRDELLSTVRRWADAAPADLAAHLLLGRVLADAGEFDDGRRVLNAVLAASPQNTDALKTLASIERTDQRYDDARALLERAVASRPDDQDLRGELAAVNREVNSFRAARLQPTLLLSLTVIVGGLLMGQIRATPSLRTHLLALAGTGVLALLALASLFIVPLG